MKSRLILAAGAACLFAVMGTARSQGLQQEVQPAMQQNAEGSSQTGTDASYGGVPATRSAASGGMRSKSCTNGPQCDIFFGQ